MRSILDFYRRNPIVLVIALVIGLLLSISAAAGTKDGWIGDVVAVGIVGVAMGVFVAWRRSRHEEPLDPAAAGDPSDPRGPASRDRVGR